MDYGIDEKGGAGDIESSSLSKNNQNQVGGEGARVNLNSTGVKFDGHGFLFPNLCLQRYFTWTIHGHTVDHAQPDCFFSTFQMFETRSFFFCSSSSSSNFKKRTKLISSYFDRKNNRSRHCKIKKKTRGQTLRIISMSSSINPFCSQFSSNGIAQIIFSKDEVSTGVPAQIARVSFSSGSS